MIIRHILLYAKNDKLIPFTIVSLFICSLIGNFFGSVSLAEIDQNKIVYTAFLIRIASILIITSFSINYIKTILLNMELSFFLSKPKSRERIIFEIMFSFIILSLITIFASSIFLFIFNFNKISISGLTFWSISMFLELSLFAIIAGFFAMFLKSNFISFFLIFSIYTGGRLIGSTLPYIKLSASITNNSISEVLFKITSFIIPRLDWAAKSAWLINMSNLDYKYFLLSTLNSIIYIAFFTILSIIDLRKKDF